MLNGRKTIDRGGIERKLMQPGGRYRFQPGMPADPFLASSEPETVLIALEGELRKGLKSARLWLRSGGLSAELFTQCRSLLE